MHSKATDLDVSEQRILSAIVFTDGVAFSARMAEDEEKTLRLIRRDLALMRKVCDSFEGQVLKSTGDGLLMSFNSALKAIECAIEIQKLLSDNAVTLPPDQVLAHRIGIHIGDVFISQGDVMGNGVNIAARLQAEAKPWGICISQTVYDVVRRDIPVEAKYLGPRHLKNIPEAIPIYEISPIQAEKLASAPVPSGGLPDDSGSLPRAIASLAQDPDAVRIKKLLYTLCEEKWEKREHILQQANWQDLVQRVIDKTSTLARLKALLSKVVRSINKQTEYTLIAQKIISQLSPCYPDYNETTQGFLAKATNPQIDILSNLPIDVPQERERHYERTAQLPEVPNVPAVVPQEVYDAIAEHLEQHEQATRIKKLIFATSQGYWENDLHVLATASYQDLIQQLRQQNTTFDHLALNLYGIVRTLNRQAEYVLVAETLLSALSSLYPQSQLPPELPHRHYEATEVVPTPPPDLAAPPVAPASAPTETANVPKSPLVYDRFALREEVVRNTNPLRAKIVIASMLYQKFTGSSDDWLWLKEKSLDTLLYDLFCYCEAYDELCDRLCISARFLDEPDLNEQTAEAICAAMKPFYDYIQPNADRIHTFEAILQGKPS
ncbi:adenylate/guanylate cyclase domain-containing protein [Trichothermofontia sichuanensis B231]|uniref:adenylate/guanylate cyclase domain-containing protein n=1 Tax=Trichothermofontia sichuanensis TaxID=3045816 RepID=UPI00224530AF|nr:adenylate/guanylate cyclase domain-containing protein [Trichothermofontia sichuanensis]UZQ54831.1 adenylate/guanylate cyclase domain-containing protein [Trichothermofontia sichuanensis B231]